MQIERALCDLGTRMSFISLSFCKKLKLLDLIPTTMIMQLADCFIRQPVGILEDVHVNNFVIPYDFVVVEVDENFHVPIIMGRPFLPTVRAVIDA